MKNPFKGLFAGMFIKNNVTQAKPYEQPAELVKELISRSVRPETIVHGVETEKFKEVAMQIREAVMFLDPISGSNGNIHVLTGVISSILSQNKIPQHVWWNEVWYRNGCKDCMEYNKRQQ